MKDYKKEDLINFVFKDGKTIWDLLEILKVGSDGEYYVYVSKIFGDDKEEYSSFCEKVSSNNKEYCINHIPPFPEEITSDLFIRMADEGKTRIDFMRFLCNSNTSLFYKKAKKLFGDDKKGYEAFRDKVTKNTRIFLGIPERKKTSNNKKSSIKTKVVKETKNKEAKRQDVHNFVYLYAIDYLYANRKLDNFGIPSNQEAYILSFDLKYFSDKGDAKTPGNKHSLVQFLAISGKIFATINSNPNIKLITQDSTYEFINTKHPGIYTDENMFQIMSKDFDCTCVCTVDNDLIIAKAINFRKEGKTPIIVTNNVNTMKNCLYFHIACIPGNLDELDENVVNLSERKYELKEANTKLPYMCFDTSYIIRNRESFLKYLCDTKSIKVIFSCVYDELIGTLYKKVSDAKISDIYNIVYALSFNPTVKFVPTIQSFNGLYVFTDNIIINNVLYLSEFYPDITLVTHDGKMASTTFLNGIRVNYNEDIDDYDDIEDDKEQNLSGIVSKSFIEVRNLKGKKFINANGVESVSKDLMLNKQPNSIVQDGVIFYEVAINHYIKFFGNNSLYKLISFNGKSNLKYVCKA